MSEKFEVISDYEKGMTRLQLMEKYGLKKTTIHDLLKSKDKEKKGKPVYRKRRLAQENLDEAVYKWYTQERAEGVAVRGIDIQHAAQ
ncbi:Tigger transposable element-derived protein 7 [Portunus trituberculatus]|uniref:Tigger transposable element-derived protein 7 n=1 Tax=Portunus trituberculatus TaxID=210409 RepID=A0A5B7IIH1_PORTR|nr:Tigger transposable element-derived protein 7 [Portunus trituberculatus]